MPNTGIILACLAALQIIYDTVNTQSNLTCVPVIKSLFLEIIVKYTTENVKCTAQF